MNKESNFPRYNYDETVHPFYIKERTWIYALRDARIRLNESATILKKLKVLRKQKLINNKTYADLRNSYLSVHRDNEQSVDIHRNRVSEQYAKYRIK